MTATFNEREAREARQTADAVDLLEHPGWEEFLHDVRSEAKAARGVLFSQEAVPEQYSHARGSLAVLKNVVMSVYQRANKEPPQFVSAMFE